MNLALCLQRTAAWAGGLAAVAEGTEVWCSYAELAQRAAALAARLREAGVGPGDRVAVFMPNSPGYLVCLWGIWWAGAVAVPVNAKLHPRELAWIVGHSGALLVFVAPGQCAQWREQLAADPLDASPELANAAVAERLQSASAYWWAPHAEAGDPLPRHGTDPAWLFYTSGTTGRPKGVSLGSRQLIGSAMAYLACVQPVEPGEVMLHPAPLSHGGGLYHLPYVLQGGLNVLPASGGFEPAECLALAAHWQRASFFVAPTMVRRLVQVVRASGVAPSGLATIVYGGGPMYLSDIEEALAVIGPHFAQIYGQGECPMTITVLPAHLINDRLHPQWRQRLASVGHAWPVVELSVRGEDGQALAVGDSGEVWVRSPVVMNGYWRNEAATAAAIRDGWLATGDVGRLDCAGFLTLLDRSKDLVVSGGSNVYPREVEEVLLQHPAVAEVSVIGRPDPEWGEVLVAYVVRQGPVEAPELDALCLAQMARFKRPKHYRWVEALPKNHYGKVLKTELRQQELAWADGVTAQPGAAAAPPGLEAGGSARP